MRVLQVSAANNGFAENKHIISTTSSRNNLLHNSTELSSSSSSTSAKSTEETFGNNNENDRTHPNNSNPNSNLEHFTNKNSRTTTSTITTTSTNNSVSDANNATALNILSSSLLSSHQQQQQQQQNSHNCKTSSSSITTTNLTTNTTTTTTTKEKATLLLEQFNSDGSLIDSTNGTEAVALKEEHQNNSINDTSTSSVEVVVDSLQNVEVDSSNYSFFEDCVNEFANLESYRRTSLQKPAETINGLQIDRNKPTIQKEENQSHFSGQSTPSFEEIHLDNLALERELNRIIRGTSISEACEDDNSCNCKSLQESLKSYELIRGNSSSGGLLRNNDDNVSIDGDDDDYDDDQMDPHHNAESITRSSELCQDDDDDSLMDDDDEEYLSSQASSCTSVSTPQRSHFPRGIINPNYPGFQHLAHTLSEHYIDHQSSDPYDSDLSEYEMELSVDSFECDFLDGGSSSLGSNMNHNNNNNLNTVMVVNNNLIDHKSVVAMDDTEDNCNRHTSTSDEVDGLTVLPLISVTQSFSDTNRNTATTTDEKESNNLQTYLNLYDSTTQQQENDERSKNLQIEIPQDDGNFGCPTPDILIKNYDSERYCRRVKPENRPDLLRNVSPNPPMKCRFEATFMEDEDKHHQQRSTERDSPPNTLLTSPENKSDMGRDDISLGLTPVDIVGDFGQEVEREFGLIVSGYNSRLEFDSYTTGPFYLYNVAEAEKMSDAQLSNGTEEIPISKYATDVDLVDLHQTHHRLPPSSTIKDETSCTINSEQDTRMDDEETPEEDEDRRASDCLISQSGGQISENSINSRLTTQDDATCDDPNLEEVEEENAFTSEEKIIPTAIVKPKYQKSSYDERQLPPIGLDFNVKSRAWFDCPSSSSGNSRSTKKTQNERNSKIYKSAKFARGNSNNSSSSSVNRFGLPGRRMGNNNKGKIAVVQPMLKDTEEHQTMDNEKAAVTAEEEQLVDNKPVEPHCTRYSFASWAASLRDSKRSNHRTTEEADSSACFDVYNIETALPEIDLEAIETHLKRANEEERRRRNDREEIRRRLAMGAEDDYFSKLVSNNMRPGRKPSLQSRMKNGKNLQICFTNEASSDTESHSSDSETCPKLSRMVARSNTRTEAAPKFFSSIDVPDHHPYNSNPLSVSCTNNNARKSTQTAANVPQSDAADKECDFFTRQARLQIEARMALSQAKDMAHMQMELDRQKQRLSPITGIIRGSLEKVGVIMAPEKRRVSRQMLTDMNIAQLQIIVNDLHTQIEDLNDSLVHYLMERDELHMGQDSMLVDIEDISRFLSAKELEDDH
ncbi:probable serine/threonine-protein kinase DDB_G0282963 [Episyrphus balteatus]|uniref:probable serine/threonine-protein kinase DDB_G0282963 n=1 Tax=Episyrphus balteatus TaxID=286459 RepID=UPI00248622D7|nr:probable serine/threonine-protein kinase DDB_G0282963 [Episyrphus balteatus]XP_055850970.1 probable serine/threonine-protein kinase DDB_G0282963 [Episyrphus balteatus]